MMSLSGDHISEDRPMATSTAAFAMSRISDVVLRSVDISGVAMSSDVLAKVTHSVIQLTTNRIRYFRHLGRSMLSFGAGGAGSSCRSVAVASESDIARDPGAGVTRDLVLG